MRLPMLAFSTCFAAATLFGGAALAATTSDNFANVPVNSKDAALVPASIKAAGTVTVASDATYAPFEYYAKDDKTMIGYDVDVSNAIAATLGLKVRHVNVTFSAILPGLAAHRYDFAMSGFGITTKRKKVVDFIGPYFVGGSGLAVAKGNPLHLKLTPLAMCGHAIGGEAGSIQVGTYLPNMSGQCAKAGKKPITIKIFKTQNEANLALTSGRVDGVLADTAPLVYQAHLSNGRFELAPGSYKPVPFGIALPKNSALKPALQAAFKTIKADGTLEKILKKWGMPMGWLTAAGS